MVAMESKKQAEGMEQQHTGVHIHYTQQKDCQCLVKIEQTRRLLKKSYKTTVYYCTFTNHGIYSSNMAPEATALLPVCGSMSLHFQLLHSNRRICFCEAKLLRCFFSLDRATGILLARSPMLQVALLLKTHHKISHASPKLAGLTPRQVWLN